MLTPDHSPLFLEAKLLVLWGCSGGRQGRGTGMETEKVPRPEQTSPLFSVSLKAALVWSMPESGSLGIYLPLIPSE